MQHTLIGLAAIIVLGVGAQWLSWRLQFPSILILLIVGFIAGPVTGFLDPDELLGRMLFPVISLSVAIILFEGGLSLNIAELREIGRVVRNLIVVGILVTWVTASGFAYLLLDLQFPIAVLFGSILVVSGPTVIVPLLRQIRPEGRVGSAVKWEGIVNDPLGAILAVLVLEVILAGGFGAGLTVVTKGILRAVIVGAVGGALGALAIVVLLRRHWIPDALQNPVALALVLLVFALANALQPEGGLLAVTLMGSALASQRFVSVRHIVEFKETLRVLLLAALFIVLAARLSLDDLRYVSVKSGLFVGALILLIRPLAVSLATRGSGFTWRERVFLALMGPRGIVAAAVASLFAIRLSEASTLEASGLAPLTFLVIIGTVAFYGIAAPIAARRLGISTPNPQGMLLVGAAPWVRGLAQAFKEAGRRVVLVDTNWDNVGIARRSGLAAHYGDILSERTATEIDMSGIGYLLALTPNDEVNALAALHFGEVLGRSNVYQLPRSEKTARAHGETIPEHLRGRWLFRNDATFESIASLHAAGWVIKRTKLTEAFGFEALRATHPKAIPLVVLRETGDVVPWTAFDPPTPRAGHTVISLVEPTG